MTPREHVTLTGPGSLAIRPAHSRVWSVFGRNAIPEQGLPLGLELSLNRPEHERRREPLASRLHVRKALPIAALPPTWAIAAAVMMLAIAAVAWLTAPVEGTVGLAKPADAAWAALTAWLAAQTVATLNAALVATAVRGPVWGLGCGGLRGENTAWRLAPPTSTAVAALVLDTALAVLGWAWMPHLPALGLGWATGAGLATLAAALPIKPGAGARLVGATAGVDDTARALYWLLVSRVFSFRTTAERGRRLAAVLSLSVALWLAVTAHVLGILGDQAIAGNTLAGVLWRTGISGITLLYVITAAAWALRAVYGAIRIAAVEHSTTIDPPSTIMRHFDDHGALAAHIPELRAAMMTWLRVDAGRRLIKYGALDRTFYWLATGSARVVTRNAAGLPVEVAVLGAGSGVGELALIEGRPRTADVIVAETAVVAALSADMLSNFAAPALARLRDVVAAGQALARAPVFAALPSTDRERWLKHGRPAHFDAEAVIVEQGKTEQWVGLIVRGRVAVERDRTPIAELGPDNVFGEMAYLGSGVRTATLHALESVLIWRWDAAWLDDELARGGIRAALRALAAARQGTP